jgi:lysophospholipase L1-like esterase
MGKSKKKNNQKKIKKSIFKDFLLALAVLLIMLVLIEIIMRISYPLYKNYNTEMWRYAKDLKIISNDPRIAHEHKANGEAFLYGTTITTNSNGWRDYEYPQQHDTYRIIVLGDSITLGWGVDFNQTFPKLLEKRLNAGQHTIDVINTGVGNYNTEMEVYSFLKKGTTYDPDMIILAYYINDAEITHARPGPLTYFFLKSYLYSFVSDKLINYQARTKVEKQYTTYYSDLYDPNFEGRKRADEAITALSAYAKERNSTLAIVIIPEMHEFTNYTFTQVTTFVKDAGKKNNVTVVDLLPYFQYFEAKGYAPSQFWVSYEDPHPNANGQAIIAGGIYASLFAKE